MKLYDLYKEINSALLSKYSEHSMFDDVIRTIAYELSMDSEIVVEDSKVYLKLKSVANTYQCALIGTLKDSKFVPSENTEYHLSIDISGWEPNEKESKMFLMCSDYIVSDFFEVLKNILKRKRSFFKNVKSVK